MQIQKCHKAFRQTQINCNIFRVRNNLRRHKAANHSSPLQWIRYFLNVFLFRTRDGLRRHKTGIHRYVLQWMNLFRVLFSYWLLNSFYWTQEDLRSELCPDVCLSFSRTPCCVKNVLPFFEGLSFLWHLLFLRRVHVRTYENVRTYGSETSP